MTNSRRNFPRKCESENSITHCGRRDLLRLGAFAAGLGFSDVLLVNPASAAADVIEMRTQTLTCAAVPVGKLEHGIGFNWFDVGVYGRTSTDVDGYPTYPELADRAGWAAVTEALDDLRPGMIRYWLAPDPCVTDKPGQLRTDTLGLEMLQRVGDWAGRNACTVLLDFGHVPKKYQFEMSPKEREQKATNQWVDMAAKDNDEYAEALVVPLLKHVLMERSLRAVQLFNAYNEPLQYGPFTTPDNHPDAFIHYVNMYRAIQGALKKARLYPQQIRLAGVEAIHPGNFPVLDFIARGVDIDPYIDVYTIHYYFHRFDWMSPVPFLQDSLEESLDRQTPKLVQYCRRRGKPLLAAEVGWYPNDGDPMPSDPLAQSRHHAALTTAETLVRGMNAGLSGFGIWSLFNPGTFDGAWRVVWVHDGKLCKAEHLYPMYRCFSRYARPGSEVFPLKPAEREWPWQYVHGTAVVTPQGKGIIYLVNDHFGGISKGKNRPPQRLGGTKPEEACQR